MNFKLVYHQVNSNRYNIDHQTKNIIQTTDGCSEEAPYTPVDIIVLLS